MTRDNFAARALAILSKISTREAVEEIRRYQPEGGTPTPEIFAAGLRVLRSAERACAEGCAEALVYHDQIHPWGQECGDDGRYIFLGHSVPLPIAGRWWTDRTSRVLAQYTPRADYVDRLKDTAKWVAEIRAALPRARRNRRDAEDPARVERRTSARERRTAREQAARLARLWLGPSRFDVVESAATVCKWGGYRHIALIELAAWAPPPVSISTHTMGVRRIVSEYTVYMGSTRRSAGYRRLLALEEEAAHLNARVQASEVGAV